MGAEAINQPWPTGGIILMDEVFLEEFQTYEGKCASCRHRGGFSGWCPKKGKEVQDTDSCPLYQGGRAE